MSALQSSVTIDPTGDLCLLVGPEPRTSILVSSKMLAMASDVFNAMFKPHFQEGRGLAQSSPAKPYELALPDDDPASMIVLCNILHFRNKDLPKESDIDLPLLKNLATLCDKYDCADAVSFVSSKWLVPLAPQCGKEGLEGYLTISYLFNEPVAFKEAAKQIVLNWVDSFDELRKKIDSEERLPSTIYTTLKGQRSKLRQSLEKGLQEPITGVLKKYSVSTSTLTIGRVGTTVSLTHSAYGAFCVHDTVKVSAYLRELCRLKLWPTDLRRRRLADVLAALDNFKDVNLGVALGLAKDASEETCASSPTYFKSVVMTLVNDIRDEVVGLCLDCTRAGEVKSDGCRIEH